MVVDLEVKRLVENRCYYYYEETAVAMSCRQYSCWNLNCLMFLVLVVEAELVVAVVELCQQVQAVVAECPVSPEAETDP